MKNECCSWEFKSITVQKFNLISGDFLNFLNDETLELFKPEFIPHQ